MPNQPEQVERSPEEVAERLREIADLIGGGKLPAPTYAPFLRRIADSTEQAEDYDATNSVRLCGRCEGECGVSAGGDKGDRACACCGREDAPHIYPMLSPEPKDTAPEEKK